MINIRPYHPTDLTALYRICLLTADNGADASPLYSDPDLVGHHFAAPYAVLEPDLCFILSKNGMPIGYILGTRDSVAFSRRCEAEWFPRLRERYPMPKDESRWTPADRQAIGWLHEGHNAEEGLVSSYPAHLHIDILPAGQGAGWGRKLMHTFWDKLRSLGVPAVHLGVSKGNPRAIGFYQHLGFCKVVEADWGIVFGLDL